MKTLFAAFSFVVLLTYTGSAQNNKYNINFSAEQLSDKIAKPKVILFEAYLKGVLVDCSLSVTEDGKGLTLFIFPTAKGVVDPTDYPQYFSIREQGSQEVLYRGEVQKSGSIQYDLDISSLDKGTYVLSVMGLQVGQQLTFSNY